jgi:hypothetical protein
MNELIQKLSDGQHPVEIALRPEKTCAAFKRCIDRGYVHVKFTGTRGGTELGVTLDTGATDLSAANFESAEGTVRLVGDLTLNYVRVRCCADVDLKSLAGTGNLKPVSA